MSAAWWVNHNGTFTHEVGGGYLWSPQREKLARSTAYDNMRRIKRGDFVISYAGQRTRHIGRATDCAIAAPKPKEFGAAGAAWSTLGWYVPVQWNELPTPFQHREHWDVFKDLLPERYSPIVERTQRGNQKVYLAEVSLSLFEFVAKASGVDTETYAASPLEDRPAASVLEAVESEVEAAISSDLALEDTTRLQLSSARRGQGKFRTAVQQRGAACRVTGLDHPDLLIASHIKPWWACKNGNERIDGANGLMLAPHVDRLFDRGFITFSDEGDVKVSPHISDAMLISLGLPDLRKTNVGPFLEEQRVYLAHHRETFLAG